MMKEEIEYALASEINRIVSSPYPTQLKVRNSRWRGRSDTVS